ncbi:hypothetical protein HGRIS_004280 [Hohenbuehelia grisea]|uniref:Uncharacterized protein n=1 Tax=Hohenbuehelia grisea TaxID=104357 RepID=A0ABR3IPA5_9AGAR
MAVAVARRLHHGGALLLALVHAVPPPERQQIASRRMLLDAPYGCLTSTPVAPTAPRIRVDDLIFAVSTLDREVEVRVRVLHRAKRDLQIQDIPFTPLSSLNNAHIPTSASQKLSASISDDALAEEHRCLDNIEHVFVVVAQECQLELVLSRVKGDDTWMC